MAVKEISSTKRYIGLSTDSKPGDAEFGSKFTESDTHDKWVLADTGWVRDFTPTGETKLDLAAGFHSDRSVVHKFGSNSAVAAGTTEFITPTGALNFLTVASTVRVKAGGNAADDQDAGAGARAITVEGVDGAGVEVSAVLVTEGAAASSPSTQVFFRVSRAYIGPVGVYGVKNTGQIIVESVDNTVDLITIEALKGQSETSAYFIPLGKTGYLKRTHPQASATNPGDLMMYQRQNALDVTIPFTGARLVTGATQLDGSEVVQLDSLVIFPPLTDLWWEATAAAGQAAIVSVKYDLELVDD